MKKLLKVETKNLSMLVAVNATITGMIEAEGDVEIYGKATVRDNTDPYAVNIQGNMCIYNAGSVLGNIRCKDIAVEGVVQGDIVSTGKLIIRQGGRVEGNIVAASVNIEDGAQFSGNMRIAIVEESAEINLDEKYPDRKVVEITESEG